MKDIFYLCAQPATHYYAWQVDTMLLSFKENGGMPLENVHIVSALLTNNEPHPWFEKVRKKWEAEGVIFSYYDDTRPTKHYVSSIRPHILEKHWKAFPWLETKTIMYHDCDIALFKPMPLAEKIGPGLEKTCFLSDTICYIGAEYIESKGHGLLEEMCEIAGLEPNFVRLRESESGGAQYLLKPGIDAQFWVETYELGEELFEKITARVAEIQKEEPDWHSLQIWCADMWAILWQLWKRGYSTPCAKDLDFTWATFAWGHDHSIYHNAGIVKEEIDVDGHVHPFYKAFYMDRSPILAPKPDKKWVSSWYYKLMRRAWEETAQIDKTITGISVMTPTWERQELLEEAIHSFILQQDPKAEMIIINDDPDVTYAIDKEYEDQGVKIINVKQKFTNFIQKLKFGFDQARWDYVYRLDDDDMLDEGALATVREKVDANPGFDIYHPENHWFIHVNDSTQNGVSGGVNTGNVFSREFINKLDWKSGIDNVHQGAEDQWYFHEVNPKKYEFPGITMLYRWQVSHYHLTSNKHEKLEDYHKEIEQRRGPKPTGRIVLKPKWTKDWFKFREGERPTE